MKQKSLLVAMTALLSITAHASSDTLAKQVSWHKSAPIAKADFQVSDDNAGALVFIRPMVEGRTPNADSSVNIALDDRFLVSVQDGHYAAANVCATDVKLSAMPTASKTNDLSANAVDIKINPKDIKFFHVDVKPNYTPVLRQVDNKTAAELLKGIKKQAHQISRVQANNCPAPKPVTPPPAPVVPAKPKNDYYVETRPNVRLDILFDFDKSDIKPQYQPEVTKAAEFLGKYPDANVLVEGHTDAKGSDAYNQSLSERRAIAVAKSLVQDYGISPARINALGFGETRPVASNDTTEGRALNRRVMVVISNN